MGKYNVIMKRKRAAKAVKKRAIHGDPNTGKLKNKPQSLSISGKRQRKVFKKWRRHQKDLADMGLITVQDVEMVASEPQDGTMEDTTKTTSKFHMKKALKIKQLKRRSKKTKTTSKATAVEASVDSMVE